jgi:hypothetical protein
MAVGGAKLCWRPLEPLAVLVLAFRGRMARGAMVRRCSGELRLGRPARRMGWRIRRWRRRDVGLWLDGTDPAALMGRPGGLDRVGLGAWRVGLRRARPLFVSPSLCGRPPSRQVACSAAIGRTRPVPGLHRRPCRAVQARKQRSWRTGSRSRPELCRRSHERPVVIYITITWRGKRRARGQWPKSQRSQWQCREAGDRMSMP